MDSYALGQGRQRNKRPVAEECAAFRVRDVHDGLIQIAAGAQIWRGTVALRSQPGQPIWGTYVIRASSESPTVELHDSAWRPLGGPFHVTTSRTPSGGVRYWWVCPTCTSRCGVLFRPVRHDWRCRVCHRVTYASSNASDRRLVSYLAHPEELIATLQRLSDGGSDVVQPPPRQILLYLRALERLLQR